MYVRRLQTKKERQKELRDKHALIKKERLTKFQVQGGREGGREGRLPSDPCCVAFH